MSAGRQLFSYFLLFVFILVSVPKELIHELHHHEDTVHHSCPTNFNGYKIEDHHVHCDYLKLEVQPYSFYNTLVVDFIPYYYSVFSVKENPFLKPQQKELITLRGPPSFIA